MLLGARTLLGAPGIATRSKDASRLEARNRTPVSHESRGCEQRTLRLTGDSSQALGNARLTPFHPTSAPRKDRS